MSRARGARDGGNHAAENHGDGPSRRLRPVTPQRGHYRTAELRSSTSMPTPNHTAVFADAYYFQHWPRRLRMCPRRRAIFLSLAGPERRRRPPATPTRSSCRTRYLATGPLDTYVLARRTPPPAATWTATVPDRASPPCFPRRPNVPNPPSTTCLHLVDDPCSAAPSVRSSLIPWFDLLV